MRSFHGSMMDPTGARPDDLAQAHRRMVQTMVPDARHPLRAPLPLAPAARAMAAQSMLGRVVGSHASQAWQAAAALPALAFDGASLREGFALGEAVLQQCWT